jgi:hypothetical protein
MEQFVTNVRNKSSNSKFLELTDYLKRSNELLRKNANHLSTVLETLDYNQHSLGVMAVSFSIRFTPRTCSGAKLNTDDVHSFSRF